MTSLIICRQLVQMLSGWPSLDLNRFQKQLRDEKKDGIYRRRKTRTSLIIHLVLTNLSFSFSLAYEYFVVMCVFHTKLAGFWPAWEEVGGTCGQLLSWMKNWFKWKFYVLCTCKENVKFGLNIPICKHGKCISSLRKRRLDQEMSDSTNEKGRNMYQENRKFHHISSHMLIYSFLHCLQVTWCPGPCTTSSRCTSRTPAMAPRSTRRAAPRSTGSPRPSTPCATSCTARRWSGRTPTLSPPRSPYRLRGEAAVYSFVITPARRVWHVPAPGRVGHELLTQGEALREPSAWWVQVFCLPRANLSPSASVF